MRGPAPSRTALLPAARPLLLLLATTLTAALLAAAPAPARAFSFGGANSYYLYTLRPNDQTQVLDALQAAGMRTLRIFIAQQFANQKGSNNYAVADVDSPAVGLYDDTILSMIDGLMLRAAQRNIKLIIALHDRYSLGCWSYDAYVTKYDIPTTNDCGSRVEDNDVTAFYRSAAAAADMDRRFAHVLAHRNPYFGSRPWSAISEAILGFDIQNEGQAHTRGGVIPNRNWVCDRAKQLKPRLSPGVLVLTGGGADVWDSALAEHFRCAYIDVVSVHSYDAGGWSSALPPVVASARASGKRVMVEEFGSSGRASKAGGLRTQIEVFQRLGVPWMVWQVVKPNNYNDFEVFTDDTASWNVLASAARAAVGLPGAFQWPELLPNGGGTPPPPPPSSPPPVAKKSPPPGVKLPPSPRSGKSPPPPAGGGGGGKCGKCNLPLCRGGCKCDNACDCRPNLGGGSCDKCNMAQEQGGCKCDDGCNCKTGTCWV